MKFRGNKFAKKIEERVKVRVSGMSKKPKIVSVLVGSDPASELYTRLKKEMAERVGINFEVIKINSDQLSVISLQEKIKEIGEREGVDGVMVQLPIPGISKEEQEEVLRMIPLEKDVDGLRWEESGVMPATVRAILSILDEIEKTANCKLQTANYVVVGARGSVGRSLVHYLSERGVNEIVEVEWDTENAKEKIMIGEVVISCVGKEGVVTGRQVQENAIVIDVGAPNGDITREVYKKASVSVEVPGGVGPVTVVSLMENALEMGEDGS